MTKLPVYVAGAFVAALIATAPVAADQKIQMKDLPSVVREAVERETKGATVKGLAKEVEGGKTFYEAETEINGHTRDLLFDATGRLIEVEEQIAIDSAPAAVTTALATRGKILRLESVTKGIRVTYEGVVEKNGKKSKSPWTGMAGFSRSSVFPIESLVHNRHSHHRNVIAIDVSSSHPRHPPVHITPRLRHSSI